MKREAQSLRHRAFEILDCVFDLAFDDPEAAESVAAQLPPASVTSEKVKPGRQAAIKRPGDNWSVTLGRGRPRTVATLGEATARVAADWERWTAKHSHSYLFVHAGAVTWNDRGIVLPGTSGSGKSCLTAALVEAGANYFSDEFAVLDEQGRLHPYPRPLRIRGNPPSQLDSLNTAPVTVRLVAILEHRENAMWKVETLSPARGILELLRHTLAARQRFDFARRSLAAAVEGATCIAGRRDEAAISVPRILELLGSPR